jgi:hypothetical protein
MNTMSAGGISDELTGELVPGVKNKQGDGIFG